MDKRSKKRIEKHLATSGARATKASMNNIVRNLNEEEQKELKKKKTPV